MILGAKPGEHRSPTTEFKPGCTVGQATHFRSGQPAHNAQAAAYTWIDKNTGYVMIRDVNGYSSTGWRREHTAKAEKVLGRKLKAGEGVHHINANKQDNRNENLLICDSGYHRYLEHRMAELYQRMMF